MARFVACDNSKPGCLEVVKSCMEEASELMGGYYYSAMYEADVQAAPAEQVALKQTIQDKLRSPVPKVALVNRFLPEEVQKRTMEGQNLYESKDFSIPGVCTCAIRENRDKESRAFREAAAVAEEDEGGALPRPAAALKVSPEAPLAQLPCCFLTGAQVLAVQALSVQKGEKVLDLCAGPGAKALLLASALFAPEATPANLLELAGAEAGLIGAGAGSPAPDAKSGRLVLNEPNKTRAAVLESLLAAFLPSELLAKNGGVTVTKVDVADKLPLALARHGPYDKILLDPPCTAARAKAVRQNYENTAANVKENLELQELLLRHAGALLKPGGLVVYSTSSIEEKENDEVVKRFLRRVGEDFETENDDEDVPPPKGAAATAYGLGLFPGAGSPHGPLYVSRIRKCEDQ